MARARNIKPSFFTNDELGELDPLARLLFIGMWTICDYKGEFEWRSKKIKIQLLPFDNCDLDRLAINLDKSGFVRFYSDGDKIYCKVVNFEVHQNPHLNERRKGTDVPAYSEKYRQLIDLESLAIIPDKSRSIPEHSASDPADSPILIPDSLNPAASGDAQEPFEKSEPDRDPNPPPPKIQPNAKSIRDWELNHETRKLLVEKYTIPEEFVEEQLIEFRLYWQDRQPDATSWDSKFFKRANAEWKKFGHSWVSGSAERKLTGDDLDRHNRELLDEYFDDAVGGD